VLTFSKIKIYCKSFSSFSLLWEKCCWLDPIPVSFVTQSTNKNRRSLISVLLHRHIHTHTYDVYNEKLCDDKDYSSRQLSFTYVGFFNFSSYIIIITIITRQRGLSREVIKYVSQSGKVDELVNKNPWMKWTEEERHEWKEELKHINLCTGSWTKLVNSIIIDDVI
jgi:hypothetical protein